jgi:hypothetical protein
VIVTGTDGLFDNLFKHEILKIVDEYKQNQIGERLNSQRQAEELARILTESAMRKFKEKNTSDSPYAKKFKRAFNYKWMGGKEDDITVLVTICCLN